MTDFRSCIWPSSASGPTVLLSNRLIHFDLPDAASTEPLRASALSLSRCGRVLVSLDQTVRVDGRSFTASTAVTHAALLCGTQVVTIGGGDAVVVYTSTGVVTHHAAVPSQEYLTCMDVSDDGKHIAVGSASGGVFLASASDFEFRKVHTQSTPVRCVRVHEAVASGSEGGVVVITKDERTRTFHVHQGRVSALEARAGKILSVGVDGRIFLFGPHGELVKSVDVGGLLLGVALSGDGKSVWVYGPEVRKIVDLGVDFGQAVIEEVPGTQKLHSQEEQVEIPGEEVDQTMKMLYGDF